MEQKEEEEAEIRPLAKGRHSPGEVRLTPEEVKAKTDHLVSLSTYFGGLSIIVALTVVCSYIVLFSEQAKFYESAEKLLFTIAGAVVGFLFSQDRKRT